MLLQRELEELSGVLSQIEVDDIKSQPKSSNTANKSKAVKHPRFALPRR
jgi:hypothetical protein